MAIRKKRLRNTVLVGSRENKKQDNFREDGVLKTVCPEQVIKNTGALMEVKWSEKASLGK